MCYTEQELDIRGTEPFLAKAQRKNKFDKQWSRTGTHFEDMKMKIVSRVEGV